MWSKHSREVREQARQKEQVDSAIARRRAWRKARRRIIALIVAAVAVLAMSQCQGTGTEVGDRSVTVPTTTATENLS